MSPFRAQLPGARVVGDPSGGGATTYTSLGARHIREAEMAATVCALILGDDDPLYERTRAAALELRSIREAMAAASAEVAR